MINKIGTLINNNMRSLIFSLSLLYLACSDGSDLSGGTGTEVPNGIVVISSTGTPVISEEVKVISSAGWYDAVTSNNSPVINILVTDSTGKVFPDNNNDALTFQVNCTSGVAIATGTMDTIVLSEPKELRGYAPTYEKVFIGGTDYSATVSSNDSFTINNIPEEILTLFCQKSGELPLTSRVNINKDTTIDISNANDTTLLFDDFIGGFNNNPLAPVTAGLNWYGVCDSFHLGYHQGQWDTTIFAQGGNSWITPSAGSGFIRCDLFIGNVTAYPYAGLGSALAGADWQTGYNLSEMTSITIRMRGTGTARLFLESGKLNSAETSHYNEELVLSSSWQTFTIPVSDLHLLPKDAAIEVTNPWNSCSDDIKRLEIIYRSEDNTTDQDYWFEIDEIKFNNVELPL